MISVCTSFKNKNDIFLTWRDWNRNRWNCRDPITFFWKPLSRRMVAEGRVGVIGAEKLIFWVALLRERSHLRILWTSPFSQVLTRLLTPHIMVKFSFHQYVQQPLPPFPNRPIWIRAWSATTVTFSEEKRVAVSIHKCTVREEAPIMTRLPVIIPTSWRIWEARSKAICLRLNWIERQNHAEQR